MKLDNKYLYFYSLKIENFNDNIKVRVFNCIVLYLPEFEAYVSLETKSKVVFNFKARIYCENWHNAMEVQDYYEKHKPPTLTNEMIINKFGTKILTSQQIINKSFTKRDTK